MNTHGEIPELQQRHRYLVGVVALSFVVLIGRLWQMQMVHGEEYLHRSQDNFIQERRIPTVRGLIFDRRGRPLVANRPSFDVFLTPRFATEEGTNRLLEELSLTPEQAQEVRERLGRAQHARPLEAQLVLRDVTRDQMARIESHRDVLPGVMILAKSQRDYTHGNLGAHVLGYLNEVTAEELKRDKGQHYSMGDLVGRFGVERMYEAHLRGVPGRDSIAVDARGRPKGGAEAQLLLQGEQRVEPLPGHDLVLTIDIEIQRLTERALRRYPSGAAIVLEVNTGRVLASASKPAFEPNLLTGHLSPEDARRLVTDPYRPLLDKVYRENYFPGSTYKVVSVIAGLEEGLIDPEEKILCSGSHHFGRRNFRCSHVHGKVNLHQAIVESCNVYFYTLAEQVGMDTLAHYARLLGLGASTGLGLNGEVSGFIPTKQWYARRGQPFRIGFTLNASIGQGNVKTTPLQIASLYATVANGGTLYLPQIVEQIRASDGELIQAFHPRVRRRVQLKPDTLERVRQALYGVVAEKKGTGNSARLSSINVSGKTGTAQVGRRRKEDETVWMDDHSWFAAYAPSERPQIAVAVLIEHGGRAAKVAAPVAMEIIESYFRYVQPQTAEREGGAP